MIYPGDILGGTYQVMRQIGRGGTGLVFLAYHRNLRKKVVIKRVRMGTRNLEALRAETDILKDLRHPNIPQVYDFLVRDGEVFTVMDYIEGQSVEALAAGNGRIPEKQLVNMLLQLSAVLDYLHRHRPPVVHSDIKPGNLILMPDGRLCLIDFNISVTTGVADSMSGYSVHFASPEQYRRILDIRAGSSRIMSLDARSDIYSTGTVFYYLMTGCYPDTRMPGTRERQDIRGMAQGLQPAGALYQDMRRQGYTDALCRVVARCLEANKNLRYGNGHSLYRAVRHLRRQDGKFRRYILLRAASWLLSAVLIGGGCWYLVKGKLQETADAYESDLRSFTAAYSRREEMAQRIGNDLLNNSAYGRFRKERPGDRITILQCLGDLSAEEGDYENAQQYYADALKAAKEAGLETPRMYRDYAVSLAENGYLSMAQEVMDETPAGDPDSAYVQAYIHFLEGDGDACIRKINEILDAGAEPELSADACVLAADVFLRAGWTAAEEAGEERLGWLERAALYSGEAKYQRLLGEEYWKQVSDARRTKEQWESAARKAVQCYRRVTELSESGTDDIICLVTALQYLGDYAGTIPILQSAMEKDAGDYRLPGYLAIAYDGTGTASEASRYAALSLELFEQGNAGDRDEELLSRLKAIRSLY